MTARKIRMTGVGLVAMPVDRDESTVTADDLASDPDLCTAWGELRTLDASSDGWPAAFVGAWLEAIDAWIDALGACTENDLSRLRAALTRARDAASSVGVSTEHEDAALAMLPPQKARAA